MRHAERRFSRVGEGLVASELDAAVECSFLLTQMHFSLRKLHDLCLIDVTAFCNATSDAASCLERRGWQHQSLLLLTDDGCRR